MKIEKKLFLQLREAATATCNNVYLMDDGRIVLNRDFKKMSLVEKLHVVIIFKYHTYELIKI